jgi:addiction module HigA family antidote
MTYATRLETISSKSAIHGKSGSTGNIASASLGMAAMLTMWRLAISTKAKAPKGNRTMQGTTTKIRPTHPGDVLRHDYLEPLGMTPNALAIAIRVPASRVGEIVNGKRSITAPTAMRLARYFGTLPAWIHVQVGDIFDWFAPGLSDVNAVKSKRNFALFLRDDERKRARQSATVDQCSLRFSAPRNEAARIV